MAQITTTVIPTQTIFPYSGMDAMPRERSDVPRAEVIFDARSAAIVGAGVGDSQRLRLDVALPVNFSYVMTDFYCGIFGDSASVANTWENLGLCNFNNASDGSADRTYTCLRTIVSPGETSLTLNKIKCWNWDGPLPKFIIQPFHGKQAVLLFEIANDTLDDQDYTLNAMIRFLQYDIGQTHHYQPNSPTLVR